MKTIFLFLATILTFGCRSKKPSGNIEDTDPVLSESVGDTLKIFNKAAVFFAPDSVRLVQIKKMLGRDTFHIAFDDYAGAANDADKYLHTKPISIVETNNQRYLEFLGDDYATMLIKLDTLHGYWGLYLFSPNKKPKLVDEFDIEKEYEEYFK